MMNDLTAPVLVKFQEELAKYPSMGDALESVLDALDFYSDPATYLGSNLNGGATQSSPLDSDYSPDHGDDNFSLPMPGKRARVAIAKLAKAMSDMGEPMPEDLKGETIEGIKL